MKPLILRMTTGSMRPTISEGDYLLAVPGGRPAPGEVWVLPPVGARTERTVHRVVSIEAGMLTARGDARPDADPPIPEDAAVARVVAVGRELGVAPRALAAALAPYAGAWLLSGRAADLAKRLRAAREASKTRAARPWRRLLLGLSLAHDELLDAVRARGLLAAMAAAPRL